MPWRTVCGILRAMNRADCPFCQPLPPGRILAEWDTFIAFFDGYPVPEGHALVIPRRHVASLFELPEHDYQQLWAQVAAAEALACLGTTAVALPVLDQCLKNTASPWFGLQAANVLGRLDESARPLLPTLREAFERVADETGAAHPLQFSSESWSESSPCWTARRRRSSI